MAVLAFVLSMQVISVQTFLIVPYHRNCNCGLLQSSKGNHGNAVVCTNHKEDSDPKKYHYFLKWLYQHKKCQGDIGAVEIRTDGVVGRRGLCVTQDISKGDYIFAIPLESALVIEDGEETSDAERGYKFLRLQQDLQEQQNFELDWKPYFDILPRFTQDNDENNTDTFCDATPDFWNDDDIAQLEFLSMIELVQEKKTSIQQLAEQADLDLTSLQFAAWLVNSRAVTLVDHHQQENSPSSGEIKGYDGEVDYHDMDFRTTCVLIPLVDLINHSSEDSNAFLSVMGENEEDDNGGSDEESLYYAVIANRDIQQGEEILISYGSGEDTSMELILNYGFVPDANQYDIEITKKRVTFQTAGARRWQKTSSAWQRSRSLETMFRWNRLY